MKAVIKVDVPGWQIGKSAHVYFPDTMEKHGICEKQEIVLCEDCNNRGTSDCPIEELCNGWIPSDDWFCADGERKEGCDE